MNYHVYRQGTWAGPYSSDQIKKMIRTNEITIEDYVCEEGKEQTSQIKEVTDLLTGPHLIPPPLPTIQKKDNIKIGNRYAYGCVTVFAIIIVFSLICGVKRDLEQKGKNITTKKEEKQPISDLKPREEIKFTGNTSLATTLKPQSQIDGIYVTPFDQNLNSKDFWVMVIDQGRIYFNKGDDYYFASKYQYDESNKNINFSCFNASYLIGDDYGTHLFMSYDKASYTLTISEDIKHISVDANHILDRVDSIPKNTDYRGGACYTLLPLEAWSSFEELDRKQSEKQEAAIRGFIANKTMAPDGEKYFNLSNYGTKIEVITKTQEKFYYESYSYDAGYVIYASDFKEPSQLDDEYTYNDLRFSGVGLSLSNDIKDTITITTSQKDGSLILKNTTNNFTAKFTRNEIYGYKDKFYAAVLKNGFYTEKRESKDFAMKRVSDTIGNITQFDLSEINKREFTYRGMALSKQYGRLVGIQISVEKVNNNWVVNDVQVRASVR